VHAELRGTAENDDGQTIGGLEAQTPEASEVQLPLLHVVSWSQLGSGLGPYSHCSPLSAHGVEPAGGLSGQPATGDPLLLPLVLPPEVDPLPLVLPPELEPLVLPLPLEPLPLLPLALPELDPPPSPASGASLKVEPPQATTASAIKETRGSVEDFMPPIERLPCRSARRANPVIRSPAACLPVPVCRSVLARGSRAPRNACHPSG
jgi:hypothetical protein